MNKLPFWLFLTAQLLGTLSATMLSVAVGWHIYQATGNPFDLALVGLMQILPVAGLFIVSGWVVDHVRRKNVLIVCSALRALVLLGLAASIGGGEFDRLAVFGLLFVNGAARAFQMPAAQSTLPSIVSQNDLSRAVAVSSTVWTMGGTAGPFVAGFLVLWFDTSVYPILAMLNGCAGLLFIFLPSIAARRPVNRGLAQLFDGIRYVKNNPLVLPAISLDLAIVLVGSVVALLPVYAKDILDVGPETLGMMRAMPALGAVIAGVSLTRLPATRHTGKLMFASLGIFAISIVVFALSANLWLSLAMLLVYGAADMVSVNVRTTIIQLATPDELRGRVNSVNTLFIATSNDMGDFRAGTAAAVIGPVATVMTGGLMAIGVALGGYLLFPTFRKLDKVTDAQLASGQIDRNKSNLE